MASLYEVGGRVIALAERAESAVEPPRAGAALGTAPPLERRELGPELALGDAAGGNKEERSK